MKFKSAAKKPRLEETSRPTVEPLSDGDAPEATVERRIEGINTREPEVPVERRNEGINAGEPEDAPQVPVERRNEEIEPEVTRSESSFQRFRNTTHQNSFEALHNKLLVTRAVKVESFLPFEEIHARLVKIFEAMEWTKLGSILSTDFSPSCVKDFYSSMALREDELSEGATFTDNCLHVFVGGKERQITKKDWGEFFDIPYFSGADSMVNYNQSQVWQEITGSSLRSKIVDPNHVQDPMHGVILDFSFHSLFCRSQRFCPLWFVHHALRKKKINVTEIMFKIMIETAQDLSKYMPYSNLITMFCKQKGWWCETYEKDLLKRKSQPITPDALSYMSFVVQDGKLVKKVKETSPNVQQPPFSGMNTQLQSINTQLKSIATQLQSTETRLTNFENRFSQFQNYVSIMLKTLYSAQQHMFGQMSGHQMGGEFGTQMGGFHGQQGLNGGSFTGFMGSSNQQGHRFSHPSPYMNPPQPSQQQSHDSQQQQSQQHK